MSDPSKNSNPDATDQLQAIATNEHAAVPQPMQRVITLKRKLAVGFSGLILLITIHMAVSLAELGAIEDRAISVIELRQPVVVRFLKFSDKLNLATTHLNGYLLTGHMDHKNRFVDLELELQKQFEEIRSVAQSDGAEIDQLRMAEFEAIMQQYFKRASGMIYLRDNSPGNRSMIKLTNEMIKQNFTAYLGIVNELILQTKEALIYSRMGT